MIEPQLIQAIRDQFKLDWHGIHGANHWARVRENGLTLAKHTGASVKVVELFAFLHDSQRLNDDHDPAHGARAAGFAGELRKQGVIALSDREFGLLDAACSAHSEGYTAVDDVTVMVCWDADRLDLGRVGIRPHPYYLCTAAAKDARMIEWAFERSLQVERVM